MQTATKPQVPSVLDHVRGITLLCGEVDAALFPGATTVSTEAGAVSAYSDGSVDCIIGVGALNTVADPAQTLRAWRRVLKEGGTLVLTRSGAATPPTSTLPASFILSLVHVMGGFECVSNAADAAIDKHTTLVFARRRLAEIRAPLAVLGPAMASAANADRACRVELLFQCGTIMLQAGESDLARECFAGMLRHEPSSAEGHFGLGMAMGAEQRWKEALCELECARRLDPNNSEMQRWLELARTHVAASPTVVLPASPPDKWSPAPAPVSSPRGLRI